MIKLIHGDCIQAMQQMKEGSVDLTVTSPPYDNLRTYEGTLQWNESIWKQVLDQLYRVTKKGGVVVWVVGDATIKGSETGTSFKQALYAKEIGFNLHDTMIWQKPNYAPFYPSIKRYDLNFEYMFVLSKGQPVAWNPIKDKPKKESTKQRGKYKTSFANSDGTRYSQHSTANGSEFSKRDAVWLCPNGQKRGISHPAPFPLQLATDHIRSWSNEGDIVLDPFMGSGTTGIAALELGRSFIGIEKVDKYFQLAQDRISSHNTEHERDAQT